LCQKVARAFGATPAEMRLADAMSAGASLKEFAESNALSMHTVRNQMRALLHNTNTRNQADFACLMYQFAFPFEDVSV
jgi:DNA-binding CsgD family transcriptional regulator